jgi:N-carbamoylputrescine amidase
MKAGFVQMSMGEDVDANTDKALAMTREAIEQGAKVICLPELFRSRYFCQTEDLVHYQLAEAVPGPTTDTFAELASAHDVVIVVSLFEQRAPGIYHNTAAVVDGKRGYVGKYRKMHIPDDPRFYEKYYFTPGDLVFHNFSTPHGELGVLVCWDQWYPEAARATALLGSEILFYPTAIGWHPEEKAEVGDAQREAWQTMQRSHAIANGCYVMAVNRTGFEPDPASDGGIEFWGGSFIAAPDGSLVVEAPQDEECVMIAELDLGAIARQRHGWPFFRDRRIDAYDTLRKRFAD